MILSKFIKKTFSVILILVFCLLLQSQVVHANLSPESTAIPIEFKKFKRLIKSSLNVNKRENKLVKFLRSRKGNTTGLQTPSIITPNISSVFPSELDLSIQDHAIINGNNFLNNNRSKVFYQATDLNTNSTGPIFILPKDQLEYISSTQLKAIDITTSTDIKVTFAIVNFANINSNLFSVSNIFEFTILASTTTNTNNIGINLNSARDWSTSLMFVDLFNQSRQFVSPDKPGYYPASCANDEWWPTTVPCDDITPSQKPITYMLTNGRAPAGDYTLIIEGTGNITIAGSLVANPGTFDAGTHTITVLPGEDGIMTDKAIIITINSPVDDIDFVMPGFSDIYKEEPFYPTFVERLDKFRVLRFLNPTEVITSTSITSQDMRTLNSPLQGGLPFGISPEYIPLLINKLPGTDAWVNIPLKADNSFVQKFAEILRDNLSSDKKVYVEFHNETWNSQYAGLAYSRNQGAQIAEWSTFSEKDQGIAFIARRSSEIFKIFSEVFNDRNRLYFIGPGWANPQDSWNKTMLSFFADPIVNLTCTDILTGCIIPNGLAIAPYFGNRSADVADLVNTVDNPFLLTPSDIIGVLRQELTQNTVSIPSRGYFKNVTSISSALQMTKSIVDDFNTLNNENVDLIAYEGGQHLLAEEPGYNPIYKNFMINLFIETNRDSEMQSLYEEYYELWDAITGKSLFVDFSNVSAPTNYGAWGKLEWQDQNPFGDTIYEEQGNKTILAPKYLAIMNRLDRDN